MDVWFCVMRRNRAERLNRESMNRLKKKLGALPSAKRILAPLDKDLSWMSAWRQETGVGRHPPLNMSYGVCRTEPESVYFHVTDEWATIRPEPEIDCRRLAHSMNAVRWTLCLMDI